MVSKFDRRIDLIEHGDCSSLYPCTRVLCTRMKIYFSSFQFYATQAVVKCLWENLGTEYLICKWPLMAQSVIRD